MWLSLGSRGREIAERWQPTDDLPQDSTWTEEHPELQPQGSQKKSDTTVLLHIDRHYDSAGITQYLTSFAYFYISAVLQTGIQKLPKT